MVQANRSAESASNILAALATLVRAAKKEPTGALDQGAAWFLARLGEHPCRLTELASVSHLDASTVSRHVSALEKQGLLAREPDPDDGRAKVLAITAEGRATLRRARAERVARLSTLLDGWDDADVAQLEHHLTRLAAQVSSKDHE